MLYGFLICSCNKEANYDVTVYDETLIVYNNYLETLSDLISSLPESELNLLNSDPQKYITNNEELFNRVSIYASAISESYNNKIIGEDVLISVFNDFSKRKFGNKLILRNTPCYDDYETGNKAAVIGYAACVAAAGWSGAGFLICSAAYFSTVGIIEIAYNKCMKQSYE